MSDHHPSSAFADVTEDEVSSAFDDQDYVADEDVVTTVLLALRMGKPLLVEGPPGAGKTELAKVLAGGFGSELVRLQCYEGLAAENALYEWNYTKQLLAVQADDGGVAGGVAADVEGDEDGGVGGDGRGDGTGSVFDEEYLLERPLLRALRGGDEPAVLLIDEVDRADEEFEALLLEVLSDFQVTVPELGTVAAETPPVVVITSNRTRGLSDALKRRCLYLHIEPPSFEKERAIVRRKVPQLDGAVATELVAMAQRLREEPWVKQPGAAETLDWARAVAELRRDGRADRERREEGREGREGRRGGEGSENGEPLSLAEVEHTLGCLLKEVEDVERVDEGLLDALLESARAAREPGDV